MTSARTTAAWLRLYWRNCPQQVHTLAVGEELLLGSGAKADIQVPDSAVSSLHCLLTMDGRGQTTVRDLNSRNGTRVNGRLIADTTPLNSGDLVQCGYVTVVFQDTKEWPGGCCECSDHGFERVGSGVRG